MNEKGITLLETLIILFLITIILAIAVPYTIDVVQKARAEGQIRTLYSNISEARQRTIQRNIPYLVTISTQAVDIYEDSNQNSTADTNEKLDILSLDQLSFALAGKVGTTGLTTTPQTLVISVRGIMQSSSTMFLNPSTGNFGPTLATVNCVGITSTRVAQGKYNGTSCDAL
jgi:Tfp pilus assembly protein FimT